MLRVYYSNRTEELLEALVECLPPLGSGPGALFEPIPLVVPNGNVATLVELAIASRRTICANLEIQSLAEFLERAQDGSPSETKLFDALLTALFDERLLERPDLELVRRYLGSAGDGSELDERRRVQLARKAAHLFALYQVSRPELLECWRVGLFLGEPDHLATESWQRRLWLEAIGGLEPERPRDRPLPRAAHLFGFSYLPRGQVAALGQLAGEMDLWVYTLNPCQEIWEATAGPLPPDDVPQRYERRGRDLGPGEVFSIENPFRLSNTGEMVPLRRWGKPGRESLRLLNALTGCELLSRMKEPTGSGLLHQIQRDIVSRRPERSSIPRDFDFSNDESIVFLECPSPRRELESVAAEIWTLLSRDRPPSGEDPLRFDDVAVLLVPSEAERYQTLLGSVFREARGIPYNVVDLPPAQEIQFAEAVNLLLDVPLDPLSRDALLGFASHPAVLASFPEPGTDGWISGWRPGTVPPSGSAVETEGPSWDRELTRLALRAFLEGEEASSPTAVSPEAPWSAGRLGLLLRSLMADAKEAARAQMTIPSWMDFASAFVSTYLEPRSRADENILQKCLDAVSSLSRLSLGGRKVPYRVARELLSRELRSLSGSRGGDLLGGVVVARLLPMRAIPFRIIFVLGLGERSFPAREPTDELDLRRAHRRPGDVGPRERDRYLFLETLLSARDRLYLSYVAKDELTGEKLLPSALVTELKDTIAGGYLSEESLPVREVPRERGDDPRARRVFPEARRERNARALGEHLLGHLGKDRLPPIETLARFLPEDVRQALSYPAVPAPPSKASFTVALSSLRRFLECPLQGSASVHFGLGDESEPVPPVEMVGEYRSALLELTKGVEPSLASDEVPPLLLDVDKRPVALHRGPALRLERPRALVRLVSESSDRFHPRRESLRGFLDHVYACAVGLDGSAPYRFVVVNQPPEGESRAVWFGFAPIGREEARSYLETLLSELLGGVHEYVLPCETVLTPSPSLPLSWTSSALGPVPHPEDYPRLDGEPRETAIEKRFGLYFRSLLPEEPT